MSDTLETSNDRNREALRETLKQSRAALDVSMAASQLDQRAWVGLAEFINVPTSQSSPMSGVRIAIRNSGKTPAINLSANSLHTMRARDEPIGDYDS